MSSANRLTIECVPQAGRRQALEFLWAGHSVGAIEKSAQVTTEPLIWAVENREILGVVWAEVTAPSVVSLATPRLAARAEPSLRGELLREIDRVLVAEPTILIAQIVLDSEDRIHRECLEKLDYRILAEVDFLTIPYSTPAPKVTAVELRPIGSDGRVKFGQLVRETFQDSRDCPLWDKWCLELGLDVLQNGLAVSAEDDCYFVQYHGQSIGALVMRVADSGGLEIRYLGILPAARRRGFARATLDKVRSIAAANAKHVTAAVDRHNKPAYVAYQASGFEAYRHCTLWAKRLRPPPLAPDRTTATNRN